MSEPTQQPQWYSQEQLQEAISAALSEHASTQQATGTISADQVQALIDSALAKQAETHNAHLQALAASMRGSVASLIPEHSGGPGTEVRETWSQYEQSLAYAAAEAARAA